MTFWLLVGGLQFAWRRFTTHLIRGNDPAATRERLKLLMRSLLQPIVNCMETIFKCFVVKETSTIPEQPDYKIRMIRIV